jgi:hypothetical protein
MLGFWNSTKYICTIFSESKLVSWIKQKGNTHKIDGQISKPHHLKLKCVNKIHKQLFFKHPSLI